MNIPSDEGPPVTGRNAAETIPAGVMENRNKSHMRKELVMNTVTFTPDAVTINGTTYNVKSYSLDPAGAVIIEMERGGKVYPVTIPKNNGMHADALEMVTATAAAAEIIETPAAPAAAIGAETAPAAPEAAPAENDGFLAVNPADAEKTDAEFLYDAAEKAAPAPEKAARVKRERKTARPAAAMDPEKAARGPVPEKDFIGTTITGRGWRIFFDPEENRTRVIFDKCPTKEVKEIVKAAGFYWSPVLGSWNKKLTFKAYRAALALAKELNDTRKIAYK